MKLAHLIFGNGFAFETFHRISYPTHPEFDDGLQSLAINCDGRLDMGPGIESHVGAIRFGCRTRRLNLQAGQLHHMLPGIDGEVQRKVPDVKKTT
jgi:hypothetical protein